MDHTKECLKENQGCHPTHHGYECVCCDDDITNAECTNCKKRFAITRTEGVNYNCGICDTGIGLIFDEDKAEDQRREKERKAYEHGMEYIMLTFTDQNLSMNGRRKHIDHICNLIGQHPFK